MSLDLQKFYSDKTLLLTGVTGFVGKVLVEKIIWSLRPKKLYLMVREKKDVAPEERMLAIFDSYVFTRLKKRFPDSAAFQDYIEQTIELVAGDLTLAKLGLSAQDEKKVTESVQVIINSAASVRFDDALKSALNINFRGPQRMLELAKKCRHLEVLTHVSTAYANSNRTGPVEEIIYQDSTDVFALVGKLEKETDEYLETNLDKILNGFPNTYTFAKNLAEKALALKHGHVKVCIVRPTIIASAAREPFPGWTDTMSAAGGISILGGLGLKHVTYVKEDRALDIVPVDYVVNTLLLGSCSTA